MYCALRTIINPYHVEHHRCQCLYGVHSYYTTEERENKEIQADCGVYPRCRLYSSSKPMCIIIGSGACGQEGVYAVSSGQ